MSIKRKVAGLMAAVSLMTAGTGALVPSACAASKEDAIKAIERTVKYILGPSQWAIEYLKELKKQYGASEKAGHQADGPEQSAEKTRSGSAEQELSGRDFPFIDIDTELKPD